MRTVGIAALALMFGCQNAGDVFECPEAKFARTARCLSGSASEVPAFKNYGVSKRCDSDCSRGEAISPNLPILAGRKTLLRVFLDSSDDFVSRDIVGRLTLEHGEDDTTVHEVTFGLNGNWNESSLSSTMNFTLEEDEVTPTTSFHIELLKQSLALRVKRAVGITWSTHWKEWPTCGLNPWPSHSRSICYPLSTMRMAPVERQI